MAILSVQAITKAGRNPGCASAAGGGDSYPAAGDGREFVEVVNGGGSSINVTIAAQQACGDFGVSNAAHDLVVAVPASERRRIRVPPTGYRDTNGRVQLGYSAVTSVTVGVFI